MDILIFFMLICMIVAILLATKWLDFGLFYGFAFFLSLMGLYLAIVSPIVVADSWDVEYTYTEGVVSNVELSPIGEDLTILNNAIILLFIAGIFSSVLLWSYSGGVEDE